MLWDDLEAWDAGQGRRSQRSGIRENVCLIHVDVPHNIEEQVSSN